MFLISLESSPGFFFSAINKGKYVVPDFNRYRAKKDENQANEFSQSLSR